MGRGSTVELILASVGIYYQVVAGSGFYLSSSNVATFLLACSVWSTVISGFSDYFFFLLPRGLLYFLSFPGFNPIRSTRTTLSDQGHPLSFDTNCLCTGQPSHTQQKVKKVFLQIGVWKLFHYYWRFIDFLHFVFPGEEWAFARNHYFTPLYVVASPRHHVFICAFSNGVFILFITKWRILEYWNRLWFTFFSGTGK